MDRPYDVPDFAAHIADSPEGVHRWRWTTHEPYPQGSVHREAVWTDDGARVGLLDWPSTYLPDEEWPESPATPHRPAEVPEGALCIRTTGGAGEWTWRWRDDLWHHIVHATNVGIVTSAHRTAKTNPPIEEFPHVG